MPRGKRLTQELREEIVAAYLSQDKPTHRELAKQYHVAESTIQRIISDQTKAGSGIKPDRRKKFSLGAPDDKLDKKHAEALAAEHPRTSDWMEHITPIHQHKMELEQAIEHKQAELDKARQEYRDYLATLKQLLEVNA